MPRRFGRLGYAAAMPDWNVTDALAYARSQVAGASDTPHSDAAELVSRLLVVERGTLALEPARELSDGERAMLIAWCARRAGGEPVAYITGRAAFRSLDLAVSPSVLIPRPETEGLVEAVLQLLRSERDRWPRPRVADLGTGSGAIALAIAAEWPQAIVTATEWSDAALATAMRNAAELGLSSRVRFVAGEWFGALDADERFDLIVSNPPYIAESERDRLPPDVRDHEPAMALFSGADGLDALREIIDDAPRHLVTAGALALELDESRAQEVLAWFEGAHDWSGARVVADLAGRPRVLIARRERGPAIAPAQWGEQR
ncbi:MAG: peptide chain release factor N(5)-glutamine methyltransferase [Candidatus Eisenbacteria bacterium]|uniref:Release factor glutamine methyltransferase n=1 Tax=Eiseniibacteriota bacterium TaxID=2212470 RepID=A0A849SRB6_UNCEI|nr:peptide chain release factor N(5)-glutamine methyltransferase [Candidatus Eisenbacteria bacterium]